LWHAFQSTRQAQRARGFLGGKLLVNSKSVYWTMTAWESDSAMNEFRTTAAHRAAMPKLLHICDEASVVHWDQEASELPSWEESYRRMVADGRLSKVNHPSPGHLNNHTPALQPSRTETLLKPRRTKL
jgi:hypothetical protein